MITTANPVVPTTGPKSTSFRLHLLAILVALGTIVTAFVQNSGGVKTATMGGGGLLLATLSTVVKLLHDKGIHVATIQAAGAAIAAAVPTLNTDFQTVATEVHALLGTTPAVPPTNAPAQSASMTVTNVGPQVGPGMSAT